ncbi:MAG: hypothetical protein ABL308_06860 [Oceanicaulis sp.]
MIAALALALALQSAGPPPEARSVPLETVFPFWTDYLDLPEDERDAFELGYSITTRTQPEDRGSWSYWVDAGDGPQPVTPDQGGLMTPPDREAFERGAVLITDAPQGGVAVSMTLTLPGAAKTEYTLAEIEAALEQSRRAMRSLMGLRALVMPRMDAVRFDFDGPAPDAVLIGEDGAEAPIESVYGESVMVRPGDRIYRGAVAVRFGRPPVAALLEVSR